MCFPELLIVQCCIYSDVLPHGTTIKFYRLQWLEGTQTRRSLAKNVTVLSIQRSFDLSSLTTQ